MRPSLYNSSFPTSQELEIGENVNINAISYFVQQIALIPRMSPKMNSGFNRIVTSDLNGHFRKHFLLLLFIGITRLALH